MDKHKQFTKNIHPIGTTIEPEPVVATAVAKPADNHFVFSPDDLSSDFSPAIDPAEAKKQADAPKLKTVTMAEPPAIVADKKPDEPIKAVDPIKTKLTAIKSRKPILYIAIPLAGLLIIGMIVLMTIKFMPKSQLIADSSKLDQSTLYIDSKTHSVGIKTPANPDGLQVGSSVSAAVQGSSNIRMGLVNGTDPSIFFEDNQKNSWQVLGAGGSFEIIQGTQTRAKLDSNALTLTNALNVGGNTTLGDSANSLVTIQGNKVATPNNLNFSDNTLVIEANKGSVAIGATTASGYKLLVVGALKATSSLSTDGQVLAGAGSPKNPSFSFGVNSNSGLYQPSLNTVGIAAGGNQVLQVQSGVAYTVNGANFEIDGFLRAGRGANNPSFQVARFTGTLDGSGGASVGDGLPTGYARALNVQAFYRGNSNEAIPLNIDYVNSGNFVISGGIPGRQYRATLIYSQDNAGW